MRRFPAWALALVVSCTSGAPATRPRTPAPSPTSPLPTVTLDLGPAEFEGDRAYRTLVRLASGIGPREDTDPGFAAAARLIADAFTGLGYSVTRQRVPVPAGRSAGITLPSGISENIVAEPPGFNPAATHGLVGAHLDTVPRSPGANDNASGVAVMMELARLSRVAPPPTPLVFVAFGGEERRRPGSNGTLFGSRHYLASMTKARRAALRGVIVLDVVGRGSVVLACSGGKTPKTLIKTMLDAARRKKIAARECVSRRLFSDHQPFENAGFTIAWLYTGNFVQLHTRRDTVGIIALSHLTNVGRTAWEALRTLRL